MPRAYDVWAMLRALTAVEAADFANKVEVWSYGALWIPEGMTRDPFAFSAFLLAHTTKLTMASGIANIYARNAVRADDRAPERSLLSAASRAGPRHSK